MEQQIKRLRGELNEASIDPELKKAIGQTIKGVKEFKSADEEYLTILFNSNKTLQLHAAPESPVGDETYINSDTDIKKMKGKTIKDIKNLDYDTEVQIKMTDGSSFTLECDSESMEGAVFNYNYK